MVFFYVSSGAHAKCPAPGEFEAVELNGVNARVIVFFEEVRIYRARAILALVSHCISLFAPASTQILSKNECDSPRTPTIEYRPEEDTAKQATKKMEYDKQNADGRGPIEYENL